MGVVIKMCVKYPGGPLELGGLMYTGTSEANKRKAV
jgi:hypothetical protein